ncbi:recombinase family protein [Streptomyces sp. NPDC013740]|uniref:recombinase family protein n=1 Tax=Streptomyces sp. NPDC013740 TaxID=3364867 RepID=UPI0036F7C30C
MPEQYDPFSGRRIVRCFAYLRMSEDREGAGLGVDRQLEDIEELAAGLTTRDVEYRIVRVFEDNDLSAYSGKPRPDYLSMLQALRDGQGDCVLSWHTDRIHRSPAELEEYIDVCQPRQIDTRTVKAGHLDLTTATGRMIARQLGVQARYEVERMIERARRQRDQMAERGEYFGGRRPFGYEPDGITPRALICPRCGEDEASKFLSVRLCLACGQEGEFVKDHRCRACDSRDGFTVECFCRGCSTKADIAPGSEAALVDAAVDLLLAGASLNSIADRWNQDGVPTSTGSTWRGTEVRSMVLRPRNAGILVHRGEEAGRGGWKALVDEAKWRSVVAFLRDEARRTTPSGARRHLGTGLYVCGVHDVTMKAVHGNKSGVKGKGIPSYSCRLNKHLMRRADLLDDFVQLAVLERVSRQDAADLLAAREEPVDVRGAQQDMRAARNTLDELAAALGRGEMDMLEWRVASGAAKNRLAQAEGVLAVAVKANPVVGLVGAESPEDEWNALDLGRQRAVVDFLMRVVVLPARRGRLPGGGYWDPEAVRIEWK